MSPSWCGIQARSSEGGLSFHSTESNQEGLLKLKARICIVNWLLLQQHRRQERSKSAQVELMIYRFLLWQRWSSALIGEKKQYLAGNSSYFFQKLRKRIGTAPSDQQPHYKSIE